MKKAVINLKTDQKLKKEAQDLAKELGLSLSDVVNASLHKFVVNQGINISKFPTENLGEYKNKKEIIKAYSESLDEF